jgi:hypothetical protein
MDSSLADFSWLTTLVSSVASFLIGWGISTYYYRRHERRQTKLATLRRLAAHRYDLCGAAFTAALNELFIVFNDSSKVRAALKRFHEDRLSGSADGGLTNRKLASGAVQSLLRRDGHRICRVSRQFLSDTFQHAPVEHRSPVTDLRSGRQRIPPPALAEVFPPLPAVGDRASSVWRSRAGPGLTLLTPLPFSPST